MNWDKPPDPGWLPIIRGVLIAYGFTLLTVLAGLVACADVRKETSFGFEAVVGVISVLTGAIIIKDKV